MCFHAQYGNYYGTIKAGCGKDRGTRWAARPCLMLKQPAGFDCVDCGRRHLSQQVGYLFAHLCVLFFVWFWVFEAHMRSLLDCGYEAPACTRRGALTAALQGLCKGCASCSTLCCSPCTRRATGWGACRPVHNACHGSQLGRCGILPSYDSVCGAGLAAGCRLQCLRLMDPHPISDALGVEHPSWLFLKQSPSHFNFWIPSSHGFCMALMLWLDW
jgi:hypothetical protein